MTKPPKDDTPPEPAAGWRGDGDKTLDLGPAHQQLHGNPGAERHAGDPADAPFLVLCQRGVADLSLHAIK
jgi:hypothetical protein